MISAGLTRSARSSLRRAAVRRTAWVVVDQGITSVTNFLATILVARSVGATAFGAFSIALAVYVLAVGVSRSLVAHPLMVRMSAQPARSADAAAASGAALVIGGVLAVAGAGAGLAIGGLTGQSVAVLALCLPALLLQDAWRFVFLTFGQPRRAVVNDVIWGVAQLGLVGALVAAGGPGVVALTAAWGASAIVAAVAGVLQARVVPAVRQAGRYVRRHVDLGGRFALEFLVQSGAGQLTGLWVALVVGAAEVGAIRGCQLLFGPFSVLLMGMTSAALPEGSRLLARRPALLGPAVRALGLALLAVLMLLAALLAVLPDDAGRAILGATWPGARALLGPMTIAFAGTAVMTGWFVGLRVLAAARETLHLRTVAGIVSIAAGVAGAVLAGAAGAVWGLAIGSWTLAATSWWTFRRLAGARVAPAAVPGPAT
jgi:O-antigen/teichoic acid export membrane protein